MFIVKQTNTRGSVPMYLTYTKDGWVPRLDKELAFTFITKQEADSAARLMDVLRPENVYGHITYSVEVA
jgi:hypothetical protein